MIGTIKTPTTSREASPRRDTPVSPTKSIGDEPIQTLEEKQTVFEPHQKGKNSNVKIVALGFSMPPTDQEKILIRFLIELNILKNYETDMVILSCDPNKLNEQLDHVKAQYPHYSSQIDTIKKTIIEHLTVEKDLFKTCPNDVSTFKKLIKDTFNTLDELNSLKEAVRHIYFTQSGNTYSIQMVETDIKVDEFKIVQPYHLSDEPPDNHKIIIQQLYKQLIFALVEQQKLIVPDFKLENTAYSEKDRTFHFFDHYYPMDKGSFMVQLRTHLNSLNFTPEELAHFFTEFFNHCIHKTLPSEFIHKMLGSTNKQDAAFIINDCIPTLSPDEKTHLIEQLFSMVSSETHDLPIGSASKSSPTNSKSLIEFARKHQIGIEKLIELKNHDVKLDSGKRKRMRTNIDFNIILASLGDQRTSAIDTLFSPEAADLTLTHFSHSTTLLEISPFQMELPRGEAIDRLKINIDQHLLIEFDFWIPPFLNTA